MDHAPENHLWIGAGRRGVVAHCRGGGSGGRRRRGRLAYRHSANARGESAILLGRPPILLVRRWLVRTGLVLVWLRLEQRLWLGWRLRLASLARRRLAWLARR